MVRRDPRIRVVVTADDFGRSTAINQAVIRAYREGALTAASLMVNGPAAAEAVELARENPGLGVGLHLTVVCGFSVSKPAEIPGLVNEQSAFSNNPVTSGWRYYFDEALRPQLRQEVGAQFQKFKQTGLKLDHVNGHLNMHLHPTLFSILMAQANQWRITHFRLTRDPFWLNARIAGGRWLYRAAHAFIYSKLSARVERRLFRERIRYPDRVFGLLQSGRVDLRYVRRLLPELRAGDYELYSHPTVDAPAHELEALTDRNLLQLYDDLRIQRVPYQGL